MYFYLSDCNRTHSSLWFKRLEKLRNELFITSKENLTNSQRHLLSSCCQHLFNQISTTEISRICFMNGEFVSLNLSDSKSKSCAAILQNATLLKICSRSYCQRWLRNSTSINREQVHRNPEMVLQKRREKFQDQSIEFVDVHSQHDDSLEKYRGFLCRINCTWTFRLIDSRSYPYFGRTLGLINNSKAMIVLQSKVTPTKSLSNSFPSIRMNNITFSINTRSIREIFVSVHFANCRN